MLNRILFYSLCFYFFPFISFSQNAGINATGATPNASSILDLNTGNTFTSPNGKGLIIPNVLLTATTDAVTVNTPFTSLLVYNTTAAGAGATAVFPGYYYWDGAKWVALAGQGSVNWALLGNAGTTVGTNFLGTTDAQDLLIRTNNFDRIRVMTDVSTINRVGIGTNFPTSLPAAAGNTPTLLHLHDGGATATDFAQLTLSAGFLAATNKLGEISFAATGIAAADRRTASIESYLTAVTGVPNVSGDLRFFTNNSVSATFTEKMRIQANGRVGMGTTAPAGQLDVVIQTASPTALFSNYGNVNEIYFQRAQGTLAVPTIIGVAGVLGRLYANGYDGAAFQNAAQIAFEVDAASGAGDMPGRIVFSTTPDGSTVLTERMRITNTGAVAFNGAANYGIAGQVLTSNGNAPPTWAAVGAAADWLLLGNAGTDGGVTNFLGTTDAKALCIRVGGVGATFRSGLIGIDANGATLFGYKAAVNLVLGAGQKTTAMGYQSLNSNTSGTANTAVGFWSLINNSTGNNNVAIGAYAMGIVGTTTARGSDNVAMGYQAMQQNFAESQSVAIGREALYYQGFNQNTNLGAAWNADNTAVGYQALWNYTSSNVTGSDGMQNTGIGSQAGKGTGFTSGNGNTFVGYKADASGAFSNATAIGANAYVTQNNTLILGSINGINGAAASTSVGIGTTAPVANAILSLKNGHLQFSQTTAPTIATSNGAAAASLTNTTDVAGNVAFTTGGAANLQVTITFNKAFAVAPIVILTPTNGNASLNLPHIYVNSTTTTFTLTAASAVAAVALTFSYVVIETQ